MYIFIQPHNLTSPIQILANVKLSLAYKDVYLHPLLPLPGHNPCKIWAHKLLIFFPSQLFLEYIQSRRYTE